MDGTDKFINNKEPKILALIFLIIFLLSTIGAWFAAETCADFVMTQQIQSMLSVLGGGRFTSIPEESAIAAGEELYAAYGISGDMSPKLMDGYRSTRNMFFFGMLTLSGIICILGTFLSSRQFFRIYNRLEVLRRDCMKISDGLINRCTLLPSDGEFSNVHHIADAINTIAERMNYLNSSLYAEKLFLKDFLTDFSHQIKTSLAVIRLNSDMLSEINHLSTEQRERLSEEIFAHIDSMESMITSTIKLAKLNVDAIEYTMKEGNLSDLCAEAMKKMDPLLRSKNISVNLKAPSVVMLSFDRIWLCEAIENMIKNSADHSECTEISVEVAENPVSATVTITDNGKGIAQEEIPKLFERFGKKSNNISMSSAGLGMSISKKIVAAHNGDILVYSSEGKGTRFEIIFLK